MDYTAQIEKYVSTLKTKNGNPAGEAEKNRTRNTLNAFCSELQTWPNEADYEAYEKALTEAGRDKKFISEYTNRIKRFFSCLQAEKERDNMTKNEDYAQQDLPVSNETESTQPDDETSTDNSAPIEPELQPERTKPGRKRGEKRVQVSVYLKQDTYEGIKLMSSNMNKTISDILEIFAENFVELNHDAIQKIKNAWNEIQVKFR